MKIFIFCMALILTTGLVWAENEPVKKTSTGKQYKINKGTNELKEMNDGGFYLNIGLAIPSKQCYVPLGFSNTSSEHFKMGPNLEVGNMFRIVKLDDNAIGIRATWLSASYNAWSESKANMSYLQGSVLRIGPYFTYAISDEMAIDGFYQIGPTYVINLDADTTISGRTDSGYLGVTHNVGACFRYKVFSFGFDVNFGSVKYVDKEEYKSLSDDLIHDFYKIRTSHFRLFAGFRF
ncbi:MAG: hypothetical protein COS14_11425 [Bacteroidetes bacterium CG02_land_8_20_14_3_00_31_25]|nr:MAG: hypothetical protein COS14_11425 [Bacteroidetes bacterium CG02_land_8_20_14_3_00_31_25]PIX32343.1 MAG: hypothetical protein COZ59_14505 [Bacteroidetes bacterium CG_4_8_14_3_um_filter_31_14]PIY07320.1 MAG: hypothetical protein COZ21_00880 [Bacteroidetes bacterium CG_4_10_14_3_um_filter_31_20]